jgi:enamine deaminase RidA (YjgF/YER057c/UK114 family)
MNQATINPWTWQDQFGFSQAIDVTGAQRVLFCSGQTATGPDGEHQHVGDMRAQVVAAVDNLETVLKNAGLTFRNVVRLNVYTTDVDRLIEHWEAVVGRLGEAGCRPACTLLGVARLFIPELLVELEATAVT